MDDMELSANVFHEQAVKAYISSRLLVSTTYLAPVGLYSAHLACECLLKALTAQAGTQPATKHDLLVLNANLEAVTGNKLGDARYLRVVAWLNPYQELGRYGALARPQHDPNRKDTGPLLVRGAVSSQPSQDIKDIDYVFDLLRGKLNVLDDVIGRIEKSQPVQGWDFPVPIEEAVLAQNDFIKLEEA
jgi:hypothetical protein